MNNLKPQYTSPNNIYKEIKNFHSFNKEINNTDIFVQKFNYVISYLNAETNCDFPYIPVKDDGSVDPKELDKLYEAIPRKFLSPMMLNKITSDNLTGNFIQGQDQKYEAIFNGILNEMKSSNDVDWLFYGEDDGVMYG